LIERGANVNAAFNMDGHTPLMSAAGNGHLDIVKLLVERGADVKSSALAFKLACQAGNADASTWHHERRWREAIWLLQ